MIDLVPNMTPLWNTVDGDFIMKGLEQDQISIY